MRRGLGLIVALLACTEPRTDTEAGPSAGPVTESEPEPPPSEVEVARGRKIYIEGVSPSGGEIKALLASGAELDASAIPCVGCHGHDGRGRPEGGMTPSNITWTELSKPYGGRSESGREHAAYDLRGLGKSITMGVDPSANQLQPVMPRYRMSTADLDSLVAYLRTLGVARSVGVDEQRVVVTLVLTEGEAGRLIERVLQAYVEEIDVRGGIYGRQLELATLWLDSNADVETQRRAIEDHLAAKPSFALLCPLFADPERERTLLAWLGETDILVIGPFSSYPDPGSIPARGVFYIDGGVPAQVRALAEHASGPALIVHGDHPLDRELAAQVLARWQERGVISEAIAIADDIEPVRLALRERPPASLLILDARAASRELVELAAAVPELALLMPGSLAIGDPFSLPAALDGRVFLAFPWLPDDVAPAAIRDYQALADRHELPSQHRPVQLASLAAAKLLLEGLTRTGRGLTRERLLDELEGLREYRSGLGPELGYGPNDRIGADTVRLVSVDIVGQRLRPLQTKP